MENKEPINLFEDIKGCVCGEKNDMVLMTMKKSTFDELAKMLKHYTELLKWKHDLEFEYRTLHQSDFENYSYTSCNRENR